MKLATCASVLSALALVSASPLLNQRTTVATLNYQGFNPPIWPPDGGCIIVARLYKKDGQLNIFDSAPVCVPGATTMQSNGYTYTKHELTYLDEKDVIWAAYGWVFTTPSGDRYTDNIDCVWPGADLSKPCLAEHELKPEGLVFPSPWRIAWWSEEWTTARGVTEHLVW